MVASLIAFHSWLDTQIEKAAEAREASLTRPVPSGAGYALGAKEAFMLVHSALTGFGVISDSDGAARSTPEVPHDS